MNDQTPHRSIYEPGYFTRQSIDTLKQLGIVLSEANKNLYTRQIDAVHAAIDENSRQLKAQLENSRETSTALEEWSGDFQEKMQSFGTIRNAWVTIASQTFTRMSELMGVPLPASGEDAHEASSRGTGSSVERRASAALFFFPERRVAAVDITENIDTSTHPASRKRRHAA